MNLREAAQVAKDSTYKRMFNGDLAVEGAAIIWTNFEGRPTKYVAAGGKRTFVLVLSKTMAEQLKEEGWNVKVREPQEEGDEVIYHTEIVVNIDAKIPPKVVLLSEFRGKKTSMKLTGDNIRRLDRVNIANVDLIIRPFTHGFSSVATIKGYANTIYVTQGPDTNFDGKYAEYEEYYDGVPMGDDPDDDTIPF
jgi:hypothetical protein